MCPMFVTECFHNKCLNCQPCVQFILSPGCESDMILSVMTLIYFSSVQAAKRVLAHLEPGKIINMDAVDRNCIDVIVVTSDSCSAVCFGSTIEVISVKNYLSVSTANIRASTNTHRTWNVILLHTALTDSTVKCVIKLLVRNVY